METDFAHLRQQLLDAGLQKYLPTMQAEFKEGERSRREREHCGTSQATPACKVEVRFLYQVLRALPSPAVFVQLVCGFELASRNSLVVGINIVQPEDWRAPLANYRLQMQMVHTLHLLTPRLSPCMRASFFAGNDLT